MRKCLISFLLLLLFVSVPLAIVMWFTNIYDNEIQGLLALRNGSYVTKLWSKPLTRPLFKLYFFNYTNVEEYKTKKEQKLRVEEVGPYTYEEEFQRVNLHFNDNGTVTYQEKRAYRYLPELSARPNDTEKLTLINLSVVNSGAMGKQFYQWIRPSISMFFKLFKLEPFRRLSPQEILFGYDDPLFDMGRGLKQVRKNYPFKKLGIMVKRNGTSPFKTVAYTGENDKDKRGLISVYNGMNKIETLTDGCNTLDVSDGSMYRIDSVRRHEPLELYYADLCRTFPLEFQRKGSILDGVPSYVYSPAKDALSPPEYRKENECFCRPHGLCQYRGLLNLSHCLHGAPMVISYPHFYDGDPVLLEPLDGLRPNRSLHDSYLHLQPDFGFVMGGAARMQLNVQVHKSEGMTLLSMFEDGMLLPILWAEMNLEDDRLTPDIRNFIRMTTYVFPWIEIGLKYISVAVALAALACLAFVLRNGAAKRKAIAQREERNVFKRLLKQNDVGYQK